MGALSDYWKPVSRQGITYLLVGAWNTLFGYGLFSLLTFALTGRVPYPYMVASAASYLVNVTVAFFSYRAFVFRASGNLLRQYLRCHCVYGSTFLLNFSLLPFVVAALNWLMGPQGFAPYLAGGLLTMQAVMISFQGHKHFSFAPDSAPARETN